MNIAYFGQASTDSDKGRVNPASHGATISEYTLAHGKDRRLEKYLAGHTQWRPDSVLWYLTSPTKEDGADAVAVYTHSVRHWRNPNVLPTPNTKSTPTASRPRRPAWWSKSPMRRTSRSAFRQAEKPPPAVRSWKAPGHESWWWWKERPENRQEPVA
ncbi:MAG: hypothetical protein ABIK89_02960 [Planctomycetota bacterium]